uniref:3-oxoacyl-[acyl-carrier-protein] reductase n=1 Tax=Tetraselmis sp. GSL018 TaxID=582737 RepID=A0A061S2S7_9CHLO
MPNLQGEWAVITGAGRGIGRAIAVSLAAEGCKLALIARSKDQLEQTAAECRQNGCPKTLVLATDLSKPSEVDRVCDTVLAECGRVEILVNNAGFVCEGNPLSGNPDEWETMLQVCLHAPMRITRRLTPAMAEGMSGYVINIGSVAAIEPMSAGAGAYAAAKHGLRGWSLSSYLTLRHKNIKCVLINPGFVNTDLVTSREAIKDKVLPDRMIQPSDIADAVKFVLHSTKGCVPEEINLRLALSAYKDA